MRLLIPLLLTLLVASSSTVAVPSDAETIVESLELELTADRALLGPNFYMEDSFLIEGRIVSVTEDSMVIEQHLDSPPRVVDPQIALHPYTLIQTRFVDKAHKLLEYQDAYYGQAPQLLLPDHVVLILYLPHNKTAKSIIHFQYSR